MDELGSRGVSFEEYDEPLLRSDDKRITASGNVHRAWFKDPDGNTFAVNQINQG
ncbi:MAG: hypothetical protein AABM43_09530 [Actinomycetota bacterium]